MLLPQAKETNMSRTETETLALNVTIHLTTKDRLTGVVILHSTYEGDTGYVFEEVVFDDVKAVGKKAKMLLLDEAMEEIKAELKNYFFGGDFDMRQHNDDEEIAIDYDGYTMNDYVGGN